MSSSTTITSNGNGSSNGNNNKNNLAATSRSSRRTTTTTTRRQTILLAASLIVFVASQLISPLAQLYNNNDTTSTRSSTSSRFVTSAAGRSGGGGAAIVFDDERATTTTKTIPLTELVQTERETSCKGRNLFLVQDTIMDVEQAYDRTIPRIVHISSKSRCVHTAFRNVFEQWKFPNHSFFYHNDAAVDRLLFDRDWSLEFPLLPHIVHCLKSGAAKIDLWRALLLYEYGGIYTDMDNAPAKFNGTFDDRDESYFVVEMGGWLSQYFFASAPKHPLMWQLVHQTVQRLYSLNDVPSQYVPYVTGPGALKNAFIHFMSDQGGSNARNHHPQYDKVKEGFYTGFQNATVTVVGTRENSNEYVQREAVRRKKMFYKDMNMTHFSDVKEARILKLESCIQRLYHRYHDQQHPDEGGGRSYWQQRLRQAKNSTTVMMADHYRRR